MSGCKSNISLIVVLVSLFSIQAFSQQMNYSDSLNEYNSPKVYLKPKLNFSLGSIYVIVPHFGTVNGFTLSPSISVPLSPKFSVDGGIIAGRYYSPSLNFNSEGIVNGAFNSLSVFGSASYHLNSQLTVYGAGIRQLTGTTPFSYLPKSSYAIGSTYKFGDFSIGLTLQMSKWNDNLTPFPFAGSRGFYSPFEQRPGTIGIFGQ
jgi:hypothetical protein